MDASIVARSAWINWAGAMKAPPSFGDIYAEFKDSFGYIRGDIRAICSAKETVNYTVALLVGCACEMLAAARGDRKHPERILEEILEPQWRPLAACLSNALQNGLVHGFDTKHLMVDGVAHQMYMSWKARDPVKLTRTALTTRLTIGPTVLAELICKKIDELEALLRSDPHRHDRERPLNRHELKAWNNIR